MSNNTSKTLRIKLEYLPPRDDITTDAQLETLLKQVGGKQNYRCERDCDCVIGLVCREGVCTNDW